MAALRGLVVPARVIEETVQMRADAVVGVRFSIAMIAQGVAECAHMEQQ